MYISGNVIFKKLVSLAPSPQGRGLKPDANGGWLFLPQKTAHSATEGSWFRHNNPMAERIDGKEDWPQTGNNQSTFVVC